MILRACGSSGGREEIMESGRAGAGYPYHHVTIDPFGGATPLRLVPSPLRDVS